MPKHLTCCTCRACTRHHYAKSATRILVALVIVIILAETLILSIGCATTGTTIQNPPPAVRMVQEK